MNSTNHTGSGPLPDISPPQDDERDSCLWVIDMDLLLSESKLSTLVLLWQITGKAKRGFTPRVTPYPFSVWSQLDHLIV